MVWRFRHSFKVIPGVRLNLSKRGLSACIGSAPSAPANPFGKSQNQKSRRLRRPARLCTVCVRDIHFVGELYLAPSFGFSP